MFSTRIPEPCVSSPLFPSDYLIILAVLSRLLIAYDQFRLKCGWHSKLYRFMSFLSCSLDSFAMLHRKRQWKGYLKAQYTISNPHFVALWMLQSNGTFTDWLPNVYPFILLFPKTNKSYKNFLQYMAFGKLLQIQKAIHPNIITYSIPWA